MRFIAADGREVVRVDRRDGRLYTVPEGELQDEEVCLAPSVVTVLPVAAVRN